MKTIAFVVQLPKYVSPAQRFRCEQYEKLLEAEGYKVDTYPFLDESTYKVLYKNGYLLKKITGVFKGFLRRVSFLFRLRKYNYIFLQREMAPIGPPIFEWIAVKLLKAKIIYDFDDAIWIPNVSDGNKLAGYLKCYWKIKWICRWAYKISVGNSYLLNFAKQYNKRVIFNPTCVDANRYNLTPNHRNRPVVVGWTGSHSTIQFLALLFPLLKEIENEKKFRFLVICDRKPKADLKSMEFIKWNRETEIEDLAKINIGIMPLPNDTWSEGKCGFKIIQYFSLGIPAIASPVGVNKTIVDHGLNGYLAANDKEWKARLVELICNEEKRIQFGIEGRKKVQREYSVESNANNFLFLFAD